MQVQKEEDEGIDMLGEYLLQVPLFMGMTEDQISSLGDEMEIRKFSTGDVLSMAGEPLEDLILILVGRVSVVQGAATGSTPPSGGGRKIRRVNTILGLGPGDYFGQRAFISDQKASPATVAATSDTVICACLNRQVYHEILFDHIVAHTGLDVHSSWHGSPKQLEWQNLQQFLQSCGPLIPEMHKQALNISKAQSVEAAALMVKENKLKITNTVLRTMGCVMPELSALETLEYMCDVLCKAAGADWAGVYVIRNNLKSGNADGRKRAKTMTVQSRASRLVARSSGNAEDMLNVVASAAGGVFKTFDDDGSGDLDYQEFTKAVADYGMVVSEAECKQLFLKYDRDGDGAINYNEFIRGVTGIEQPETTTVGGDAVSPPSDLHHDVAELVAKSGAGVHRMDVIALEGHLREVSESGKIVFIGETEEYDDHYSFEDFDDIVTDGHHPEAVSVCAYPVFLSSDVCMNDACPSAIIQIINPGRNVVVCEDPNNPNTFKNDGVTLLSGQNQLSELVEKVMPQFCGVLEQQERAKREFVENNYKTPQDVADVCFEIGVLGCREIDAVPLLPRKRGKSRGGKGGASTSGGKTPKASGKGGPVRNLSRISEFDSPKSSGKSFLRKAKNAETDIVVDLHLVCQEMEMGGAQVKGTLQGPSADGNPFREAVFSSNVLLSGVPIQELPIRTRAVFSVESGTGIPIGWAACNVFDHEGRMIKGNRTLRLLPDTCVSTLTPLIVGIPAPGRRFPILEVSFPDIAGDLQVRFLCCIGGFLN